MPLYSWCEELEERISIPPCFQNYEQSVFTLSCWFLHSWELKSYLYSCTIHAVTQTHIWCNFCLLHLIKFPIAVWDAGKIKITICSQCRISFLLSFHTQRLLVLCPLIFGSIPDFWEHPCTAHPCTATPPQWNPAFQILNFCQSKHWGTSHLSGFSTAWEGFWSGKKRNQLPDKKSRIVKKTTWRIFSFEKKNPEIKKLDFFYFFQIRTLIYLRWVLERFFDWSKNYWRIFTSFLCLSLAWVLFSTLICDFAHLVWGSTLFWHGPVSDYFFSCSTSTKNKRTTFFFFFFFKLKFRTKSLFFFLFSWLNFSGKLLCSVFISCRLGQYHLCFQSWAAAVRTSIFFPESISF